MKAGWGSGCIAGNFRLYVNGFFIARSQSWVATKTPPMGAVGVCQSDNWLEQNSTRLKFRASHQHETQDQGRDTDGHNGGDDNQSCHRIGVHLEPFGQ
jgi:hypothetical protein